VTELLDAILIHAPNSCFKSRDSTLILNLRVIISVEIVAAALYFDINNSSIILGEEQVFMLVHLYFLCRNQQAQLITSLNMVLGNKPNLTLTIEGIKPISETKTQVVIYVQEKSVTGNVIKLMYINNSSK